MKKVLVVGCGVSGKAVIDYLLRKKIETVAVDQSKQAEVSCPLYPEDHNFVPFDFDLVVLSPGVRLDHPQVVAARAAGVEVIGEVELALRQLNNRAVGVTGTNGKSTTVSLIAHILGGIAVGNIGTPVISLVDRVSPDELLVIELSSFQLMTMKKKSLDVAVLLNITPDHLDWHGTMEAYEKAKMSIRDLVKEGGEFFSFVPNLEAAWLVSQHFGLDKETFEERAKRFKALEHRLEYVTEVDGVRCVNDSKATNIASMAHALEMTPGRVVLIAGGINKGVSMVPVAPLIEKKARLVILMGQSKHVIASELTKDTPVIFVESMKEAVQKGLQHALRGDTLLLAPGCSSFDMFLNYMARGQEFKRMIHESKRYDTSSSSR